MNSQFANQSLRGLFVCCLLATLQLTLRRQQSRQYYYSLHRYVPTTNTSPLLWCGHGPSPSFGICFSLCHSRQACPRNLGFCSGRRCFGFGVMWILEGQPLGPSDYVLTRKMESDWRCYCCWWESLWLSVFVMGLKTTHLLSADIYCGFCSL